MNRLVLLPDTSGYTAADGEGALSTRLDGGASKYRKGYLNAVTIVTCQWTCSEEEYLYFRTFYNLHEYGTRPFITQLVLHSYTLTDYECRFIPGTFRLNKVAGRQYTVRANLEVVPNAPDAAFDEGFVVSYEAFGQEASVAFALLRELVNVNFPEVTA